MENLIEHTGEPTRADRAQADLDQKREMAAEERERLIGGSGEAFLGGLARGVLGPIPDILSTTPTLDKEQMEAHPVANISGQVAGFATGALTGTGLGGILSAMGKGASRAVAAKTGSKALGTLAAGAVEGAGVGISEGTSKAALDSELGIPGAASHIMESAGHGAALGGAMGILGHSMYRTANWLFKRGFKPQMSKVAKAQTAKQEWNRKYNALLDKLDAMEKSGQSGSLEHQRLVGNVLDGEGMQILGGTRKATAFREFVEDPAGVIVDGHGRKLTPRNSPSQLWEAKSKLKAADQAVRTNSNQVLKKMAKDAQGASRRVGMAAIGLMGGGGLGPAGLASGIAARYLMPGLVEGVGGHVLRGMHSIRPLRRLIAKSLQAGELTMERTSLVGGQYVRTPYAPGQAFRALAKAMKIPPVRYLSAEEYRDVADEVSNVDLGSYEAGVRQSLMSHGVPQEFANAHIDSQIQAIQYLQQHMPQSHDNRWMSDTGYIPSVAAGDRLRFARRVRAALAPLSVFTDFMADSITKEAAETLHFLHPTIAKELGNEVLKSVELAAAYGKKFAPHEERNISLLVDPFNGKMGRFRDNNLIQSMQANYNQEANSVQPAQPGGPGRTSGNADLTGVNDGYLSPSQSLQKRINRS